MSQRQAQYRKKRPSMDDLMPESSMQLAQEQAANLLGYWYFHIPARVYATGLVPPDLPDTIIVGYGRLAIWENKVTGANPTPGQQAVIDELCQVRRRPDVRIVRPADLDDCLAWLKDWRDAYHRGD